MIRTVLILLTCLLFTIGLQAQKEETVFGKTGLHLSGAWGGSAISLTSFKGDYAVLSGGFGGLEFNRSVFVGWGGYRLTDEVKFADLTRQGFDLDFNGLILGAGVKSHNVVHPQLMLLTGTGIARLADQNDKDRIVVIQPSAGVTINVFRWFHLGLEGGYRFVNGTDLNVLSDRDLSGAFGQVRLQFGWSWGW